MLGFKRLSLTERTENTEKRGIMGVKKGIYLAPDHEGHGLAQTDSREKTEK